MSWWRKKADDEAGDDILDLKDVVWRGVNQNDRLDRLAEAAKQTDGELPDPGERIYPPKQILPTVPLPIAAGQSTSTEDHHKNTEFKAEEIMDDDELPLPQEDLSAPEQFIETEIRNQIITEAMDAVLMFQKGQSQSPDEDTLDNEELEAAIGKITDQTLAEAQNQKNVDDQTSPQPMAMAKQAMPSPQSPDMSNAIRDVVADEIGLWLKDHMPRIIAETMSQASLEAAQNQPRKMSKAAKSAPKAAPKSTAKKTARKAVKTKTKPKVQVNASKKPAKTKKTKAKKGKS